MHFPVAPTLQAPTLNNTYRYSNCRLIEDINISRLAGLQVNPLPVSFKTDVT